MEGPSPFEPNIRGYLRLELVTPVIQALFAKFQAQPPIPSIDGKLLVQITDRQDTTWSDLQRALTGIANVPHDVPTCELLDLLKKKFGPPPKSIIQAVHHHTYGEEWVGREEVIRFALWCDDGHGLAGMEIEEGRHTSGEQFVPYGCSEYIGRHCLVSSDTADAIILGVHLDSALADNDTDRAAALLTNRMTSMLSSVIDPECRALVRTKILITLGQQWLYTEDFHFRNCVCGSLR